MGRKRVGEGAIERRRVLVSFCGGLQLAQAASYIRFAPVGIANLIGLLNVIQNLVKCQLTANNCRYISHGGSMRIVY